jgi:catechol 2,3-dioxygenase-like lactoylglutathione lyase family enzyme
MIHIEDVVYARIASPDLEQMEKFLLDFGMQRAARTDNVLYMRGYGPNPVVHVVEKGPAHHIGFAMRTASRADLDAVAAKFNSPVEGRSEPGGGSVVRLTDPSGNQLEVVHGIEPRATEALRKPEPTNWIAPRARFNDTVRLTSGCAHVMRLGHVAIHTAKYQAMDQFYRELFGMKISDTYYMGEPANVMAEFLHCGLGDRFTDHHTLAIIGNGRSGFDHLGFEVLDMDDLLLGNRHLHNRKWEHSWGVGRHIEGSQIFDYWRDPIGLKVEHWTDGDLVNDAYRGHNMQFDLKKLDSLLTQWGPPFNPDFMR